MQSIPLDRSVVLVAVRTDPASARCFQVDLEHLVPPSLSGLAKKSVTVRATVRVALEEVREHQYLFLGVRIDDVCV